MGVGNTFQFALSRDVGEAEQRGLDRFHDNDGNCLGSALRRTAWACALRLVEKRWENEFGNL